MLKEAAAKEGLEAGVVGPGGGGSAMEMSSKQQEFRRQSVPLLPEGRTGGLEKKL